MDHRRHYTPEELEGARQRAEEYKTDRANIYFNGRRFIPAKLADEILSDTVEHYLVTPVTARGGDVVWVYHPELGIFKDDGVAYIEDRADTLLENHSTPSRIGETLKLVRVGSYTDREDFEEDPSVLVLENGVYHLDTEEFTSHNAIYNAKAWLPVKYDPGAECPKIMKFLETVLPAEEDRKFLQQWFGYHFLKDYRYQRSVVFHGGGDNGKTTCLNLLIAFLGPENVSCQTMFMLTTDRFASANLYAKLANIADDIGPKELRRTGTLKMLTGGGWIDASKKFQDAFKFRNYAKLTWGCNQVPQTPDDSLAFYKRFIPLKFGVTIPLEEQDPLLIEKITTPDELSGLLNWALVGLKDLLEQGYLAEPSSIAERKEQYARLADPITAFIMDCVDVNPENPNVYEEKQDVLNEYFRYCKKHHFIASSETKFFTAFKKIVFCREQKLTVEDKRRTNCYIGIKLTEARQRPQRPVQRQGPLEDFTKEGKACDDCGAPGTLRAWGPFTKLCPECFSKRAEKT